MKTVPPGGYPHPTLGRVARGVGEGGEVGKCAAEVGRGEEDRRHVTGLVALEARPRTGGGRAHVLARGCVCGVGDADSDGFRHLLRGD